MFNQISNNVEQVPLDMEAIRNLTVTLRLKH